MRPRERPTCWSSCSTTWASHSSAASGPTSPHRRSTGWPQTACATRTSTPPRCARRPARASSPGATTTASAWAGSPTSPPASPGITPASARSTAFSPRCSGRSATATYAVGKWHLTPDDERHLGASRARWPLRRGFDRFYGFFGGETHQFAPSLVLRQPSRGAAAIVGGRLPPQRGHRRPGDRVRRRPGGRRPRQAVLPLSLHGRLPLAPPRAAGLDRAVPRPLRRRLGRVAGGDLRPAAGARSPARRDRALAAARVGAGVGLAPTATSNA